MKNDFSVTQVILMLCLLNVYASLSAQTLRISEYSIGSASALVDEEQDISGWVELINTDSRKLNLGKYSLSDTAVLDTQWRFPRLFLSPGERILVHLSGKNRRKKDATLHADFKLNSSEQLSLYYGRRTIQSIPPNDFNHCQSYATLDSANMDFLPFVIGSPGQPNNLGLLGADVIEFNHNSGRYSEAIQILPTCSSVDLHLRYSLDGTDPTIESPLIQSALVLDSTMLSLSASDTLNISANERPFFRPKHTRRIAILGVALFDQAGNQKSETAFKSYVLEDQPSPMPILSLIGSWDDLFSDKKGILNPGDLRDSLPAGNCDKRGRAWERLVQFDMMEVGQNTQSLKMGLRAHGGSSRKSQQKGLRLYARKSYGNPNVQLKLFSVNSSLQRLALKPVSQSYSHLGIEDHLSCFMAFDLGLESPKHLFSEVYINGIYQGVYSIHQRIDEKWLKSEFGVQKPILVSGWNGQTKLGVDSGFIALINFVTDHDLSDSLHYAKVAKQIDMSNFIDYQIFEQFIANRDWPKGNVKCWRNDDAESKWRWIFFDGDAGLRFLNYNPFLHAMGVSQCPWCRTGGTSSILLEKLWENTGFRSQFMARAKFLATHHFTYAKTEKWLDIVWNQLKTTLNRQINRYNNTTTTQAQEQLNGIKSFLKTQPERYKKLLSESNSDFPLSPETDQTKSE